MCPATVILERWKSSLLDNREISTKEKKPSEMEALNSMNGSLKNNILLGEKLKSRKRNRKIVT